MVRQYYYSRGEDKIYLGTNTHIASSLTYMWEEVYYYQELEECKNCGYPPGHYQALSNQRRKIVLSHMKSLGL